MEFVGRMFVAINLLLMGTAETSVAPSDEPKSSGLPKVLLIALDGFRHDFLKLHGPLPNFEALKKQGVYVPVVTPVYPTVTFPNLMSMATGLLPCVHGGVYNVMFDRALRKEINFWAVDDRDGVHFFEERGHVMPLWVSTG
jgi:predicted AlkP superfamily pyrophosphatase or phosphodiesterase